VATFRYRAKEVSGRLVEGVIEAPNNEEAIEKINGLSYFPIAIEEVLHRQETKVSGSVPPIFLLGKRIRSREITLFGQQLSTLLRSSVPILRALAIIAEPSENPPFKELLNRIRSEMNQGRSFSSVLNDYPQLFSPLYSALVSAGESSGTLDQALSKITAHRQKQEEILSRIRSALSYPLLMALTGIGTIVFMITFVMPRLTGVFSNLGGNLPMPTRILIQASTLVRQNWGWILGVLAVLLLVFLQGRKTKAQRYASSLVKLRLPILGALILKAEIARFARTLEILLKSGISVLKAIEVAAPVLDNEILKKDCFRCLQDLKEGGSFGHSLKKTKWFPSFVTNLITVGEESGKLEEALCEIAAFYERETDEALRTTTSLLEPLMILGMGLVVGFIVIAMLLPLFELNLMVK